MFVRSINIRREGDWGGFKQVDPAKPFRATIEVDGEHAKVELLLSPEMSKRIVAIIADEVAAAGRATAHAMVAEVLDVKAIAAAAPAAEDDEKITPMRFDPDEEIPF